MRLDADLPYERGEERTRALDFQDWLDAYEKDVNVCADALEGDVSAIWEAGDRTWRVSYTADGREVVYRWFERLESQGRNQLELVEGCQTVPTEWEYETWRDEEGA